MSLGSSLHLRKLPISTTLFSLSSGKLHLVGMGNDKTLLRAFADFSSEIGNDFQEVSVTSVGIISVRGYRLIQNCTAYENSWKVSEITKEVFIFNMFVSEGRS